MVSFGWRCPPMSLSFGIHFTWLHLMRSEGKTNCIGQSINALSLKQMRNFLNPSVLPEPVDWRTTNYTYIQCNTRRRVVEWTGEPQWQHSTFVTDMYTFSSTVLGWALRLISAWMWRLRAQVLATYLSQWWKKENRSSQSYARVSTDIHKQKVSPCDSGRLWRLFWDFWC